MNNDHVRRRQSRAAAVMVLLASLVASVLTTALTTAPAHAAARPGQPDVMVEQARLGTDGVRKQVRFVMLSVPKGVRRYEFVNNAHGKVQLRCTPAQMRNGSGAKGCFFNTGRTYAGTWTVYAVGSAGRSKGRAVLLQRMDPNDGTVNLLFASGGARDAAAMALAATRTFKRHAVGCAKDAAVTAGLKTLNKLGRGFMKSPNPYVAGASLIAQGIYLLDKASGVKNRCAAIGALVKNVASAMYNARRTGKARLVYSESTWMPGILSSCSIYTNGTSVQTRARTMNENTCRSFWGGLVS